MSAPFPTKSPKNAEDLPSVTATPTTEVSAIVLRAREAQKGWAELSVAARCNLIAKVKGRVLGRAEEIAKLVSQETGKPEVEALLSEALPSGDVVDYWVQNAEEMLESLDVEIDRLAYPGKSGWIHREARGVVALIQPWNFPVALPLRTLIPALVAGNAVIFKPSEVTPRSGELLVSLFKDLVPEGLVGLVQGGREQGQALCEADVDLVVFTGSVASGKKVAAICAERLVPCALELGGKDAAIVLADANLDRAANGIVWGAMVNAGQNCASVERVYVEKSVEKDLTDRIVKAVKALRPGIDIGPMTTTAQREIVARHVTEAKDKGAVVHAGGEVGEGEHAYAPTVLTVTDESIALMKEETFGPVIPIVAVDSAEDAVTRANGTRFGLTASVWTRNVKKGEALGRRLRAGVVTINNHAFTGALPGAPWTGVGDSGWGVTNSPFALDALTRPRFILVDKNRAKKELYWYPYTDTLRGIAVAFAKLRGGGVFAKVGAILKLLTLLPKRLTGGDARPAKGDEK
jgi:acyl-CoA reductase-like NAD-dependent aldehyde dehydrogenase